MKRVSIYFVVGLLFLVLSLQAQEQKQEQKQEQEQLQKQENPFSSFMGVKWGVDAVQFKSNFQYKDKLRSYSAGFYLTKFALGDEVIKNVFFAFKAESEKLKFEKENYTKFKFTYVLMDIEPKQFEAMYDIFKVKYGEPIAVKESEIQSRMGAKYNQKIATWTNEGRHIILMRYADKIDEGRVFFSPVVEVDAKGKEEKDKAAADKL